MKPFELAYRSLMPFLCPLHSIVRRRLVRIARSAQTSARPVILDVGGRKSHYTIGVPGRITITDLPRKTDVQHKLNLGLNATIIAQTKSRRSNVEEILFDDMTCSTLPDATCDCVVAVEVLEHVEADTLFVCEVHRVLRPGGTFLMTTPNGDFCKNTNPDHKRHYTHEQLSDLLKVCFEDVNVEYAVKTGLFHRWGLRSWSLRRPWRTALSAVGNFVNAIQSANKAVKQQAIGTHHLIATARKSA